MDWIAAALRDPSAGLFYGWDNVHKKINPKRRVAVVIGNYVVIIQISHKKKNEAFFITAFVAGSDTINKIRGGKKWP